MKITINNVDYRGHHYEEVVVDVPNITDFEHEDASWMLRYFIEKELGRLARE